MARKKKSWNIWQYGLVLIVGFLVGILLNFTLFTTHETKVENKEVVVLTDTFTLENQNTVDLYLTESGKYIVISLEDLKYVTKKNRRARKVIKNLEALFSRLQLPEKEPVKPKVK